MNYSPPEQPTKVIFPKRESSWFARHAIWLVPTLLIVVGSPLLCFGSIFMIGRYGINLVLGPRDAAVAAMELEPAIVAAMGSPLSGDNNIQFRDMQVNNNNGHVEIEFNVSGPQQRGNVSGIMLMKSGNWEVGHIKIQLDDGQEFSLGDSSIAIEDEFSAKEKAEIMESTAESDGDESAAEMSAPENHHP